MAERVRDTIDVRARVEELFAAATDFNAYPLWNENITNVEILERDPEGRATRVWMRVDAKLKVVSYTLAYDYTDAPEAFAWRLVDGDVRQLEGSYRFRDLGEATEVTYEITVDPGFPLPGLIKRQAERQIARSALEDLKRRVEFG
jgi:uncharacterized membrane protein